MIYRNIIRPLFFLFGPESVHHFVVSALRIIHKLPGITYILKYFYQTPLKSLERTVFGIKFNNPVGLAAGFDKNAEYYNELASFGFSFIEIGTVTPLEQAGNPKPRSFRLTKDKALINRMGINNHGADKIAANLKIEHPGIIIGGNIGKNSLTPNDNAIDDYKYCFKVLYEVVDYFVLNISCPNIGDIKRLQDADIIIEIVKELKRISAEKSVQKPILLKISPDLNFNQLDELVQIAFDTGIDGFVATNTTTLRNNLTTPGEVIEEAGNGGMSGMPLRDRSTEIIKYLAKKSKGKIPIIGVGGIMDAEDAKEKINAGASLIQIYTGFIYEGPSIVRRINKTIAGKTGKLFR